MVPHGERVPIVRAADFQLNQEVPLIQQYANYKMIFDTMEPSLCDKLFMNNVLNCSNLAQLWRVESTWLLVPGEPINIAQVCNIVDRQSMNLEKGLKTPTMTELLAMNAGPGYYTQEPLQTAESLIFLFLGFLSANNHTKSIHESHNFLNDPIIKS